jgi:hypothetical protein
LLKLNLRGKGVLSFKNFWDAEPPAYVSSWEVAEEWVAKRIAQEKKAARAKPAPPPKAKADARR